MQKGKGLFFNRDRGISAWKKKGMPPSKNRKINKRRTRNENNRDRRFEDGEVLNDTSRGPKRKSGKSLAKKKRSQLCKGLLLEVKEGKVALTLGKVRIPGGGPVWKIRAKSLISVPTRGKNAGVHKSLENKKKVNLGF